MSDLDISVPGLRRSSHTGADMRLNDRISDAIFRATDTLISNGQSPNLAEWQSAWATIGRGVWAIFAAWTAFTPTGVMKEIWGPLGVIWPLVVCAIGIWQIAALVTKRLSWRKWACMASIACFAFGLVLFLAAEIVVNKSSIPIPPLYLTFIVTGAIRYVQLDQFQRRQEGGIDEWESTRGG
jgi:hypothetical protein